MKSTPKGSILRKLAISLIHQLGQTEHVELRFAYLWARFVRHLRKRHIDQGWVEKNNLKIFSKLRQKN